jgi:hypothetical protein
MLPRLLLDPGGDVQRLHVGDRRHKVVLAPGHELRHGETIGADVGGKEFQEAERGTLAGGGDQRFTGDPAIAEPDKHGGLGWFPLDAVPDALTSPTIAALCALCERRGTG